MVVVKMYKEKAIGAYYRDDPRVEEIMVLAIGEASIQEFVLQRNDSGKEAVRVELPLCQWNTNEMGMSRLLGNDMAGPNSDLNWCKKKENTSFEHPP